MHLSSRTARSALFLLSAVWLVPRPAPAQPPSEPSYPPAEELLASVRERLPAEPMRVEAILKAKTRTGGIRKVLRVEMDWRWSDAEPSARFVIRDRFGRQSEEMTLTRHPDGAMSYAYRKGDPLEPADPPNLFEPVRGCDFTWADLGLAFLWWKGGKTVGAEQKKGRFCYVLDLPAPPGEKAITGMRLWIDPEMGALLQAETYAANGRLARRMKIKSFQKIDDRWTLKDMDLFVYPSHRKTTLRVEDIRPL